MSGVIWVAVDEEKRAAFYTLGCKVNQQETAALQELFRRNGYQIVDYRDQADVYIINTCTVTHLADQKSRQMIRRAVSRNPGAVVAVMGCYSQVAPEGILSIPGVSLVVGTAERHRLPDLVAQAIKLKESGLEPHINAVRHLRESPGFEELPATVERGRTRAFLKIQDGCDQFCTYCIVPFARGPIRSLPPELVRDRLEQLVARGYREVVLTGVHTSAYGRDLKGEVDLTALLKMIGELPGDFRVRLSSVEPADVTDELLQVVASSPRFCRHLHLPLQSGNDRVLKAMGRPYDTAFYRQLFLKAEKLIPGLAVTADVMVGFPGETAEEFESSCRFIDSLNFRDLHVFKYSPRPGTLASSMPGQLDPGTKDERSKRLLALAVKKSRGFTRSFLGQVLTVLVERPDPQHRGFWEGLSDNYLRVFFKPAAPVKDLRGNFLEVRIGDLGEGDTLMGEILNRSRSSD